MKVSLSKARRLLHEAESALRQARQKAFVEVSPFDPGAEALIKRKRDNVLAAVNQRARALDVLSTLRTKVMQAEMDSGLTHLENELHSADEYLEETEALLAGYRSEQLPMMPGLFKEFDEAKKATIAFPVLDEASARELECQLDKAHRAKQDIQDQIEEVRSHTKIELENEQAQVLQAVVSQ